MDFHGILLVPAALGTACSEVSDCGCRLCVDLPWYFFTAPCCNKRKDVADRTVKATMVAKQQHANSTCNILIAPGADMTLLAGSSLLFCSTLWCCFFGQLQVAVSMLLADAVCVRVAAAGKPIRTPQKDTRGGRGF